MLSRVLVVGCALSVFVLACGSDDGGAPANVVGSDGDAKDAGTGSETGTTSSGSDGGVDGGSTSSSDGGTKNVYPPLPPGAPITGIANETWTWVDVPGTKCANGTPTGIGVNFTDKSDDVLIFLEGGGACWDGATCWGTSTSAVNLYGYGAAQFATDAQLGAIYTMNRLDPDNAFKDKNIVYVPYCTGDSHSGDTTTTLSFGGVDHPTSFAGFTNVGLDLARVVATFTKTKRVWLSGDSAGGFGSAFNFGRVQEAFPGARVDVLDDSGQPIAPDAARWPTWKSAWNMQLPSDCAACAIGPGGFVDYYAAKYPNNRFGLVSFAYDTVIPTFMDLTPAQFHDELYALADHMDAAWPNGGYFVLAGSSHVGLATPTPALKTWVTKMVTDDKSWASTKP